MHDFDDVADDPQVAALEVFRPTPINDGVVQLVNHPNRYDGKVPELRVKGLKVGEHTREILLEHGFSPEQIDDPAVVFAADPLAPDRRRIRRRTRAASQPSVRPRPRSSHYSASNPLAGFISS